MVAHLNQRSMQADAGGKIVDSRLKLETGSRVALGDRCRINKVMVQFCAAVNYSNKSNKSHCTGQLKLFCTVALHMHMLVV